MVGRSGWRRLRRQRTSPLKIETGFHIPTLLQTDEVFYSLPDQNRNAIENVIPSKLASVQNCKEKKIDSDTRVHGGRQVEASC